jgi:malonyl CoA-acyl carrier protein transacylase
MKVYVFPGQGSQRAGMGMGLFDEFKIYTEQADEILGYSIKKLCLEDPDKVLSKTNFTQPALYVVNALSYLKKKQEESEKAEYFAGHSLGEYNALFAAGAFDFATGLRLVKKRGELMNAITGGGMAAVIGTDYASVADLLRSHTLDGVDVANYNSVTQTVLSGLKKDLEKAERIFEANNIMFVPLVVSAAFHSRYMREMVNEYALFLNQFNFNDLHTPVIANVSARPYKNNEIAYNLREQLSNSVQWVETIRYLRSLGVLVFEEVGPGNVLDKLIKNIIIGK